MRWVLDTTAFSHLMQRDNALESMIKKYPPKNIVTVPPVVAEIQYGLKRLVPTSKKHLLLTVERDRILKVVGVLPWIDEASSYFGEIKAYLEKKGEMIDDFDIAISAIALSHGAGVITTNMDHFCRIKNLECMAW